MPRRKRKTGRPTKLDPELVARMIDLIRKGVPSPVAAGAVGIGETTYWAWMKRGKQPGRRLPKEENAFRDFRAGVLAARHAWHAELASAVCDHGKSDGKLGLAILGKRGGSYWADRDSLELRGSEEAPLRVSIQINRTVRELPSGSAEESPDAEQD